MGLDRETDWAGFFAERSACRERGWESAGPVGRNPLYWPQYERQRRAAESLVEKYGERAVSSAWSGRAGKKIKLLTAPHFRPLVEMAAGALELEAAARAAAPPPPPPPPPSGLGSHRPPFVRRPSLLSKLEDDPPTPPSGDNGGRPPIPDPSAPDLPYIDKYLDVFDVSYDWYLKEW